jgi:hypothetical protein
VKGCPMSDSFSPSAPLYAAVDQMTGFIAVI